MFGLAIWDVRRRRLVVARDAMGIKLVYYRTSTGAADVRIGRSAPSSRPIRSAPEVDPLALNLFLKYPLHAVAADDLQGRPQARAGDDAGRRRRRVPRGALVQLHAGAVRAAAKTTRKPTEELLDLYKGAVKRHLLSDVPVGHSAERRARLGSAAGADERARRAVAGLHRRIRRDASRTTNWRTRPKPQRFSAPAHSGAARPSANSSGRCRRSSAASRSRSRRRRSCRCTSSASARGRTSRSR